MRGVALRQRGELQDLGGVHILVPAVVNRRHLKVAFGNGSGLVHDQIFDVGQCLHKVGALDQDAFAARAADPAEEGQRNADHDRAGTADDQECESPVDPVGPQLPCAGLVKYQNIDKRPQDR